MEENSIEQGRQGELKFFKSMATLLYMIKGDELGVQKMKEKAEAEGLSEKPEFHITIIGREIGEKIKQALQGKDPEKQEEILSDIEKLANEFGWGFSSSGEFYLISETKPPEKGGEAGETRRSIVEPVHLPDLESFYERLNELLGTDLKAPFPHVTLFTTSTKPENTLRGIGIYSKEEFNAFNPQRIEG